jgi:hypothetical protein
MFLNLSPSEKTRNTQKSAERRGTGLEEERSGNTKQIPVQIISANVRAFLRIPLFFWKILLAINSFTGIGL